MIKLSSILFLVEKPEAEPNDIYGRYLFGMDRNDAGEPGIPEEPDTGPEIKLKDKLTAHYGVNDTLSPSTVNQLLKLKQSGKYVKPLKVPDKYQYAYRFLSLPKNELQQIVLGGKEAIKSKDILDTGLKRIPQLNPRSPKELVQSWTVTPDNFFEVSDLALTGPDEYMVLVRALIHKGNNKFLLNPDVFLNLDNITEGTGNEMEVISIGSVGPVDIAWSGPFGFDIAASKLYKKVLKMMSQF